MAIILISLIVVAMETVLLVVWLWDPIGTTTVQPPPIAQTSATSTPRTEPERPGPLAVAPNGMLYIADDARNQILARLPTGRFRVVAGDGTAGFSGDGGPAVHAALDQPEGMAFAPSGALYFADSGNRRVRVISPSGIITTVAGNGALGSWTASGTPALSTALNPSAVAIGPDGDLYVAANSEVLRLGSDGLFTRELGSQGYDGFNLANLANRPATDAAGSSPDGLAFDSSGNLYIAGFNTGAFLVVSPQGTVSPVVGSQGPFITPQGDGGVVVASDGSVLAISTFSVVRVTRRGVTTVPPFPQTTVTELDGIYGFSPDGIAVDRNGTIYLDTDYGNGFADESALLAIQPNGRSSVLWRQGARP
ncbi:MAG: hypothetical protein ACLQPH_12605 [Acidimicrobiales bacterium]